VPYPALPPTAAWHHRQVRNGFEVVFFTLDKACYHIHGSTTAAENGQTWAVEYHIELDASGNTQRADITGRSVAGHHQRLLTADGSGHWRLDGKPAPDLEGCRDIDLESSAMTNALPVRRLTLGLGQRAAAPAAYVLALDLTVQRLEQAYVRVVDEGGYQRYDYAAPAFDFACRLAYDGTSLVVDYPGIARRVR
jgi:hypothetical protein